MTSESRQNRLDVQRIRLDFPILNRQVRPGVPLVYLDSTATSQKPEAVIRAMDEFYRKSNANIHRGIHTLAEEATAAYEATRKRVADFINAPSARQIIFTRNATESINLVAYSWGRANIKAGGYDYLDRDGTPFQPGALASAGRGTADPTGIYPCR